MSEFQPTVRLYEATVGGFFVNVFLIETANGVVAVDGALALSSAKDVRAIIKNEIEKDLIGVILTHGHPDHYTGVGELVKGYGDIPIVATEGAIAQARQRDEKESAELGSDQAFGAEYPKERVFPNTVVSDGEAYVFDGVSFAVEDIGACESDSDSVWFMKAGDVERVFIGDLVYNQMHPFIRDGHLTNWIETLDRFIGRFDHRTVFHTGHGKDMGIESFYWQKSYLEAFQRALKEMLGDGDALGESEEDALFSTMQRFLPNDRLLWLMRWQFKDTIRLLREDGAL